jgi:intracellular sulfur oxidation DsrE/DsrF family protein
LAATLSAFNVVDIRVCETSAKGLGLDLDTLFPFVDTVTYGPAEVVRLIEVEKYRYF